MPISLSWPDLIIETIPEETSVRCLKEWDFLLSGTFAVVGMSRFGDWFLRRPDDRTEELSVIEGTLKKIADTPEEFAALMNTPQWQEEHLLSWMIPKLYEQNIFAGPDQCYGFAPHPALYGRIDSDRAVVLSIPVWQTICAQTFAPKQK
jgi:hypothetical protein